MALALIFMDWVAALDNFIRDIAPRNGTIHAHITYYLFIITEPHLHKRAWTAEPLT